MNGTLITILPLVLLIVVMYFLMIRPQKKREKETTAMRNSLQVGDEIITIGGICGKIVKTKEESIVIQVNGDKTKMEMMRWSVSKVVKEGSGRNRAAEDFEEISDAEENEVKKSMPKRMKKAAPAVEEETEEVTEAVEEPVEATEAVEEATEAVEEKAAE